MHHCVQLANWLYLMKQNRLVGQVSLGCIFRTVASCLSFQRNYGICCRCLLWVDGIYIYFFFFSDYDLLSFLAFQKEGKAQRGGMSHPRVRLGDWEGPGLSCAL